MSLKAPTRTIVQPQDAVLQPITRSDVEVMLDEAKRLTEGGAYYLWLDPSTMGSGHVVGHACPKRSVTWELLYKIEKRKPARRARSRWLCQLAVYPPNDTRSLSAGFLVGPTIPELWSKLEGTLRVLVCGSTPRLLDRNRATATL